MSYSSFEFLAFLAVVLLVYYIVPKRFQWFILLAASYAFYLIDGIMQVLFLIGTTLVTYSAGRIMQNKRDAYKKSLAEAGDLSREEKQARKKAINTEIHRVQVIAVIIDLGALIVVKYLNFLLGGVNSLIGLFSEGTQISLIKMLVPLGISFYTFMSMGYLIDIGRGKYEAEKHIGKFALFVSFFPSIIQGPINRFDDVGLQLGAEHKLDYNNLKFGAQLMLWGFFKKLVIADRVAPIVSTVFSADYESYSGTAFFIGIVAFTFQLYGDFSGGIDIAKGAAQMFGIILPDNFQRPYFSQSIAEFWRRWHMTLGAWMKDYIFFPIMLSKPIGRVSKRFKNRFGNQAGKIAPSVITTFIVFFLIGIWHGATLSYVVYAIYNAVVVAGGVALEPVFKKMNDFFHAEEDNFSWKLFRIIRTFLLTGISKIIVCSPGLIAAGKIFVKIFTEFDGNLLFGVDGRLFELGMDKSNCIVFLFSVIILFVVSLMQEKGMKLRETLAKQNIVFRWGIYLAALIIILVFGMYGPAYSAADFIYKQY